MVVFTGAGVSAESGITTFRDAGGLWSEFPPETFATWNGLLRVLWHEPEQCARFLVNLLGPVAEARPNAAHHAIARLETHFEVTVVTQNVDHLHQDAGSTVVHEIHGSLLEIVALNGRFVRMLTRDRLKHMTGKLKSLSRVRFALPRLIWSLRPMLGLSRRGFIRPRVVLFGEAMAEPDWTQAMEACRSCEVMLVVGTSGAVMPAALLPAEARDAGAKVIAVDPHAPEFADVWLRGTACEMIPELVSRAWDDSD